MIEATNGGALALEDGLPRIREVREGRPAVGRGWIGITPRGAYETRDDTFSRRAHQTLFDRFDGARARLHGNGGLEAIPFLS